MKDIPRIRSAFRVWLALALSALLLCGVLTGCSHGKRRASDEGDAEHSVEATPASDETKNEEISSAPINMERPNSLLKEISELSPNPGGGEPGPKYWQYENDIAKLQGYVNAYQETNAEVTEVTKAYLTDKIASLHNQAQAIIEAGGEGFSSLQPTLDKWNELLNEANNLRVPSTSATSGGQGEEAVQGNIVTVVQTAQSSIQSDLNKIQDNILTAIQGDSSSLQSSNLKEDIAGLRQSGGLMTSINMFLSAVALVAMLVAIWMIWALIKMIQTQNAMIQKQSKKYEENLRQFSYTPQNYQGTPENRAGMTRNDGTDPYGTLDKSPKESETTITANNTALSDASSAGKGGLAPTVSFPELLTFKLDTSQNTANKDRLTTATPPAEFSGEPTNAPDEYRIWPDPLNRGLQSQNSQEISRGKLYFGYVKEFFDIEPTVPGNFQSFTIQIERCATVRKSGNSYQLRSRGKIRAQGNP